MKKTVLAGIILLFSSSALADGFVCVGQNTGLKVSVFNHTQASEGTRTPAILVISDPALARTNRTIASFSGGQTLKYEGYGSFMATVDLQAPGSSRGDLNIAGTTLAQLQTINLAVDFSYASGTARLARVTESIPAKIIYTKITGEVIDEKATCARHVKTL
jgi:hypothetical protein